MQTKSYCPPYVSFRCIVREKQDRQKYAKSDYCPAHQPRLSVVSQPLLCNPHPIVRPASDASKPLLLQLPARIALLL